MAYIPDLWVILKIKDIHKVLASWKGGYLDGDIWRLNSGIVKVEYQSPYYNFYGYSGSLYQCHEKSYGTSFLADAVLQTMQKNAEVTVLPKDFDFLSLNETGSDS